METHCKENFEYINGVCHLKLPKYVNKTSIQSYWIQGEKFYIVDFMYIL